MDLTTTYLGFDLPHPLMPGASPLADDLDNVRRLEDAGAAAIVLRSLFEEQIIGEQLASQDAMELHADAFSEATSYLPDPADFVLGPDDYLQHLSRVKDAVDVPVIGSLNGVTPGGWIDHAALLAEAGADAMELNVYNVAADPAEEASAIESRLVELCASVKAAVQIPVAVKLSPFYTSLPNLAARLGAVGIDGLVVFNRFYQSDIDLDELDVVPSLRLSDESELLPRLRAVALLSGRVTPSLAVSGGVHSAHNAVKAVMCGAHAVQLVSALLQQGAGHLAKIRKELSDWLEEHEYESLGQMQGSMGLLRCPDPRAFERAQYVRVLQSWRGDLTPPLSS